MNYRHNNNVGRMRHRITFLTRPEPVNGYPAEDEEWTDTFTVWAEVKTQKGSRLFNSDATQWQGKKIVGVRYRPDIVPEMRFRINSTVYEIESLTNDDELNQWFTIVASEVL